MGKTIIVSNRLPLSAEKTNGKMAFKPSSGGLATGLGCIFSKKDNLWIGWPGMEIPEAEQLEVVDQLGKGKMFPIFLDHQQVTDYYEGFSNGVLWPAFHYFPQYITYDEKSWNAYVEVNEKFCAAILEKAAPDDTIWIHDYHLLLLPQMIKQVLPEATVAFFQHIPFPSYEIFRMLPWREELLAGMCGADLVGFHTYDDMRHFMSAVSRVLGFPNEGGYIRAEGHLVNVDAFPMGIDYQKYEESAKHPATQEIISQYKSFLGEQKLLISIDRLDYSKGIPQRLKAFELFLEENVAQREKVSLIMIVVPSREQVREYAELKEEIDTLVGRINSNYSTFDWVPIHYFYRSFPLEELSAFYSMADVGLVTPLRDGMNLVCKEFVASKVDKKGVLILSEMAGASKELQDAILVNPNDIQEVASAIEKALTMDVEEQSRTMQTMQENLRKYDVFQWVQVYMKRLEHVNQKQAELRSKRLDAEDLERLQRTFNAADKPVVFLDYDGTLAGYQSKPQVAFPDWELKSVVRQLAKKTLVVIISGRDRETLGKWFEHDPVTLMAEHGLWVKRKDTGWCSIMSVDNSWKPNIRQAMDYYVLQSPGAYVEEKANSLIWHCRGVENKVRGLKMREIFCHLKYLAQGNNLQVLEGNLFLEIKGLETDKSNAAMNFIARENYDFILAIGDHGTDEETFKALPAWAFSIRVGDEFTHAKYHVKSQRDVKQLLHKLGEVESLRWVI
ncbi:MAG TPA: bifunctional alpha,alpha-trehalose-phosphate synthase (UDP-forming)/trehalose-phosphatase [Cyclobacteriaceae bacterium]|nr:bifunctional alpha,alpha-trehalose-phosphate synthase (UDP-forming)/trehalose-phosphatase [Cyclobacteriaceae bacterium]